MRNLVTGGSGYFGSCLVRRLVAAGEEVRVLDLQDADDRPEGVEFVAGDIRDPAAVRKACDGAATVYHCVAMVPLARDEQAFWSVNFEGTRNLLRAARDAGADKVLYVSSSAVYGSPESNPVDEETPPRPGEAYGAAKLAAEEACREFAEQGLSVTTVRPRTIMGHGRLGIMQILFEWIRQGKRVPIMGSGDNVYQFVHADDLAAACIAAARRPESRLYNVGAAAFGTMRETLEGLIAHAGTGSRLLPVPLAPTAALINLTSRLGLAPLSPYHALMYGRSLWFDVSRARTELGWSPRYSNVEMFRESYDWYLANRDRVMRGHSGTSHHRSAAKQGLLRALGWLL